MKWIERKLDCGDRKAKQTVSQYRHSSWPETVWVGAPAKFAIEAMLKRILGEIVNAGHKNEIVLVQDIGTVITRMKASADPAIQDCAAELQAKYGKALEQIGQTV